MFEALKEWLGENGGGSLHDSLYKALDEVVKLPERDIYSYNPEEEANSFIDKRAMEIPPGMEFHYRNIPHEGDMDVAAEGNEYGKSPDPLI
ncbi:hypothetical protein CASFOL_031250 [Castilleja foliolosa]|uniref:Uncharacterized protein n=1 Tax=Castilleja foliolosa TaxID=1961234 RepID=A0ABD3C4U4_9LAMI